MGKGNGNSKKVIELPLGGYSGTHSLGGVMPSAPLHLNCVCECVRCSSERGEGGQEKKGPQYTTCVRKQNSNIWEMRNEIRKEN